MPTQHCLNVLVEILSAYPYLENDDIQEALSYAAWRVEELDVPLDHAA